MIDKQVLVVLIIGGIIVQGVWKLTDPRPFSHYLQVLLTMLLLG